MTIDAPNTESYWPFFLPDGRHFLFFGRPEKPGIYVALARLDDGNAPSRRSTWVSPTRSPATCSRLPESPGIRKTARWSRCRSMRLDSRLPGPSSVVAEHVAYETLFARAAFSSSQNGRVVYQTEYVPDDTTHLVRPAGQDNSGRWWLERLPQACLSRRTKQRSPLSGRIRRRKELTSGCSTRREMSRSRLTVDPAPDWSPVWSPDGSRVLFTSPRDALPPNLYQQDSRGAGPGEFLLRGNRVVHPRDWSSDGRFVVVRRSRSEDAVGHVDPSDGTGDGGNESEARAFSADGFQRAQRAVLCLTVA